jgi:hypothetical protein
VEPRGALLIAPTTEIVWSPDFHGRGYSSGCSLIDGSCSCRRLKEPTYRMPVRRYFLTGLSPVRSFCGCPVFVARHLSASGFSTLGRFGSGERPAGCEVMPLAASRSSILSWSVSLFDLGTVSSS